MHSQISVEDKGSLILKIAKDAVLELEIPELAFNEDGEINQTASFYEEAERDIYLYIALNGIAKGSVKLSLFLITLSIFSETERISKSKLAQALEFDESNVYKSIEKETIELLKRFINFFLPTVNNSVNESLRNAFVNYFSQAIEPNFQAEMKEAGLSRKFSLFKNRNLKNIIESVPETELPLLNALELEQEKHDEFINQFTGKVSDLITTENRNWWLRIYEDLRRQYTSAKDFYEEKFNEHKSNYEDDEWKESWKTIGEAAFPELTLIEDVNNYQANELAYRQIGEFVRLNWERVKKKLQGSKGKVAI